MLNRPPYFSFRNLTYGDKPPQMHPYHRHIIFPVPPIEISKSAKYQRGVPQKTYLEVLMAHCSLEMKKNNNGILKTKLKKHFKRKIAI